MPKRSKKRPIEDADDDTDLPAFDRLDLERIDELAEEWRARGQRSGEEFAICAGRVLKALAGTLSLRDDEAREALELAALKLLGPKGPIGRASFGNLAEVATTERDAFRRIVVAIERIIAENPNRGVRDQTAQVAQLFVVLAKQRCPKLLPRVREARSNAQQKNIVAELAEHLFVEGRRVFICDNPARKQAESWFRVLLLACGMPKDRVKNALNFRAKEQGRDTREGSE